MDYSRQILYEILHRAKYLNTDANGYKPKSLLAISVDTGISVSNLSKIFSLTQIPTALNLIKILKSLDCHLLVHCDRVPHWVQQQLGTLPPEESWKLGNNEASAIYPEHEDAFGFFDEFQHFHKTDDRPKTLKI